MPLNPFYSLNKLCLLNIFQDHTKSTRSRVIPRLSFREVDHKVDFLFIAWGLLQFCAVWHCAIAPPSLLSPVNMTCLVMRAWWQGGPAWTVQTFCTQLSTSPSVSQKPWIASQPVSFKLVTFSVEIVTNILVLAVLNKIHLRNVSVWSVNEV